MTPTLCVSIPVHERPPVILDQIENIRAFLPADTIIVLHCSQLLTEPKHLQAIMPEGVYVNETSLPTAWGDTAQAHNSNFQFIDEREDFDAILLHASNDAYVRPGVAERVGQAEAGVQLNRVVPEQRQQVHTRDLGLAAAHEPLRRLGRGTVYHSQPEGMFFERDLFRRMVKDIQGRLGTGAAAFTGDTKVFWGPEHYVYPTAASVLTTSIVPPILYSEVQGTAETRPMSDAVILAIREGRFAEREYRDPNQTALAVPGIDIGPPFWLYDFDHLYAVKRVARQYDHPLRAFIRTLARAELGRPLRWPSPVSSRGMTIVALAQELVADPGLLPAVAAHISADDPVTIAIGVLGDEKPSLTSRIAAIAEQNGLTDESAPDLELRTLGPGELGLCELLGQADAVLSEHVFPAQGAHHLRIGRSNAPDLPAFLARWQREHAPTS